MPAHSTNKTNLASIKSAVATFRSNASLATDQNSREEIVRIAKELDRVIERAGRSVQGLP